MKLAAPLRSLRFIATALALPLMAGCGEDDPGPVDPPPATALYAITTRVSTGDATQSYVILTDTVDSSEALKLDGAIEIPGGALGVGVAKSGALFVGSTSAPTVTRYNLTTKGSLEKVGTVSFQNQGASSIGEYQHQFQFVSETKAYYFDGTSAKAVIWNPTDMTVTGSIDLSGLVIQGARLTFATLPFRVGDLILMPVGWRPSAGIGITKQAAVVIVDTKTDTATIAKDDRCGYVRDGVLGPDGQVYLATEVYGSAVRRVAGGDTPVPCLLRLNPQTRAFDSSFFRELSALVNGGTAGSLLPGPQGTAYLRVLDESQFEVKQDTHPRVLASASAWKWWQLRLDTLTATPVDGLPSTSGSSFLFEVGNRTLFTEFTNGSSTTNLRELTDRSGKVTASMPGMAFSYLQVR
ncbi:hypothetical protein [Hyalangium sp.]|uniref:hypothetical protein n=1 Tax=Hyalangium sp. TaxID=2028555 RepID=UPI002D6FA1E0|nr:hypothetical protein [Hyalangium sp.]HYI00038.1 hypothetical protein [Hyalangium sp.]